LFSSPPLLLSVLPNEKEKGKEKQKQRKGNTNQSIMDGFDVTQLFSVEGLVAVVTGGGTGIGLCTFPPFSFFFFL